MSTDHYIGEAKDAFCLDVPSFPMGIVLGPYPTHGFLAHMPDGTWYVVTDDNQASRALPSFIRERDDAIVFLRHAYINFRAGIDTGAEVQRRETTDKIATTLGMPTLSKVERLERDLEDFQDQVLGLR